ncbi:MAG: hypothetical protein V1721_06170 [Pseudomonadota bacterium]
MKRVAIGIALAFLCFVLAAPCAFAQNSQKPTKESLLLIWEKAQKESPYTVKLEKTSEQGVYDYETTIFPFKGKLKVLNLLIDKNPSNFYDYYDDSGNDADYVGIVEVKLLDVPKEFAWGYTYSYPTWEEGNRFHYDAASGKWYTLETWHALEKASAKAQTQQANARCSQQSSKQPFQWRSFLASWWPLFLLVGFWIWVWKSPSLKKFSKKQKEQQERAMQIAEENLVTNREILEVLKRKQ